MRISARADYAVRAMLEMAANGTALVKTRDIASAQDIPPRYLEQILPKLRQENLVISHRGAAGGHTLACAAAQVSIADVIRAVDGPIVFVNGERPGEGVYHDAAAALPEVWIALREAVRGVLDVTTLADVVGPVMR